MKIKDFYQDNILKYPNKLKIFKKWIFWILLEEEAFFMSKYFSFKMTSLDKNTIKIWFPDSSKNKYLWLLDEKNIWYVLIDKKEDNFIVNFCSDWKKYYNSFYNINLEDFSLTKQRILWLNKIWFEEKNEKNFLLKDKIEDIYIIVVDLLLKLPKKERYFFREKIERLFLDLFEQVYNYMYNIWDRKNLIESIFNKSIILREFFRLLYKIWKIKNDNIYLNLWDKWIEVLKICKWIKEKNK